MTTTELLGYLGMLAGGAVPWLEAVVVVPVGIVAGLAPVPATVLAVAGNLLTVVLAALWGERLNRWWVRRRRARATAAAERAAAGGEGSAEPRGEGSAEPGGEGPAGPSWAGADAPHERGRRRSGRATRLWRRYGLPGLAVLAPVVTGTQLAAFAAVTAGAPRGATVWWISASTAVWAVIAAAATITGVGLFAG